MLAFCYVFVFDIYKFSLDVERPLFGREQLESLIVFNFVKKILKVYYLCMFLQSMIPISKTILHKLFAIKTYIKQKITHIRPFYAITLNTSIWEMLKNVQNVKKMTQFKMLKISEVIRKFSESYRNI